MKTSLKEWLELDPNTRGAFFHTTADLKGRYEFLVNDNGKNRWTLGRRDWKRYLSNNGLVEIDPKESLKPSSAYSKSVERFSQEIPKAVEKAIHKVRHKPYFDKRAIGQGIKPTSAEIKSDMERYRISQLKNKERKNGAE